MGTGNLRAQGNPHRQAPRRGCELGDAADEQAVERFRAELALFSQPIAGTGILPYDFNPNRYLSFRTALETEGS